MDLAMFLEMMADAAPDRLAVGTNDGGQTYSELLNRARALGAQLRKSGAQCVTLLDVNSAAVPLVFYAAALSGLPFAPLNYRLADPQLHAALARLTPTIVVAGPDQLGRCIDLAGVQVLSTADLDAAEPLHVAESGAATNPPIDDGIAVLLFTSGTTAEPKAAVLRAEHLTSYVLSSVEFLSAEEDEAILVSVPPYHIAGISTLLTSVFSGRRIVHLAAFTAESWVDTASAEAITHAMVVPTMLGRILDVLEQRGEKLPALRHLSYGGGRMPPSVVERALRLLPHVDLVNAYGLTETSSTIAVLDAADHRAAVASDDPVVRARLGSVGTALPSVTIEIRDSAGAVLGADEPGEIWVQGPQVSGEYLTHTATDATGWFPTRDRGWIDIGGYLFVDGRADDVIVRGGENLSPGEIEDVLLKHSAIADAAVVGLPSEEWGEVAVAAVVLRGTATADQAELQEWVRVRLRSSRVPAQVYFVAELPHTETGKLVRRRLRDDLMTLENTSG